VLGSARRFYFYQPISFHKWTKIAAMTQGILSTKIIPLPRHARTLARPRVMNLLMQAFDHWKICPSISWKRGT
jgi:hypothetical protein